mmetsp:Transcript_4432/g.14355  ORF Transcript_4432/g.14355 Transcript_4432/m.14355 type:complete len:275 (-) Transcript_4432:507-1331(-)
MPARAPNLSWPSRPSGRRPPLLPRSTGPGCGVPCRTCRPARHPRRWQPRPPTLRSPRPPTRCAPWPRESGKRRSACRRCVAKRRQRPHALTVSRPRCLARWRRCRRFCRRLGRLRMRTLTSCCLARRRRCANSRQTSPRRKRRSSSTGRFARRSLAPTRRAQCARGRSARVVTRTRRTCSPTLTRYSTVFRTASPSANANLLPSKGCSGGQTRYARQPLDCERCGRSRSPRRGRLSPRCGGRQPRPRPRQSQRLPLPTRPAHELTFSPTCCAMS